MQFTDWYAPAKISSSAEYSVLQVLLFHKVSVHMLPGGTGIRVSHNWPNESFVKRKFNTRT
jgi:hypothetical protein